METKKFDQRTGVDTTVENKSFAGVIVCPICWKSVDVLRLTDEVYRCVACDITFDV